MASHIALYGNVTLTRGWCHDCSGYALVIKGKFACCDREYSDMPRMVKRMSTPEDVRRLPPLRDRRAQLSEQEGKCFYCLREFGRKVYKHGVKPVVLRVNWDHVLPYSYSQDNHALNFVAACQICNGFKSSRIYATVWDAQVAIATRWAVSRYSDLPTAELPDKGQEGNRT